MLTATKLLCLQFHIELSKGLSKRHTQLLLTQPRTYRHFHPQLILALEIAAPMNLISTSATFTLWMSMRIPAKYSSRSTRQAVDQLAEYTQQ